MSLTEDEIRPKRFDVEKKAALDRDLAWLTARTRDFVVVNCPACGSVDSKPAFTKYGFRFVQCAACRTAYMSPRATQKTLGEFYANSALYEFWNAHIFPATREIRQAKIFRPRVDKIVRLCRQSEEKKGVLVDVGAANGAFCEEAVKSGCFLRVIAVEPSRPLAETCREIGLETIQAPLEDISSLRGAADVVTSFETIEHVFSPVEFVGKCRQLLKVDGILVLSCPNYEGFDIQALGVLSESLDAEHVNLLNPSSLILLVESLGFEVIECSTPGELDVELVHQRVVSGEMSVPDNSFLKCLLVDRYEELRAPFQNFLSNNRLSSHMFLAARYTGKSNPRAPAGAPK
jgi:2-polyprenyl-3-methyl-5-hydroxy-6-metoxy-1,4-benzoquinol methylase